MGMSNDGLGGSFQCPHRLLRKGFGIWGFKQEKSMRHFLSGCQGEFQVQTDAALCFCSTL